MLDSINQVIVNNIVSRLAAAVVLSKQKDIVCEMHESGLLSAPDAEIFYQDVLRDYDRLSRMRYDNYQQNIKRQKIKRRMVKDLHVRSVSEIVGVDNLL
jgi:hypothetical protein